MLGNCNMQEAKADNVKKGFMREVLQALGLIAKRKKKEAEDKMRATARTSPSVPCHRDTQNPSMRDTRLCDKGKMTTVQ